MQPAISVFAIFASKRGDAFSAFRDQARDLAPTFHLHRNTLQDLGFHSPFLPHCSSSSFHLRFERVASRCCVLVQNEGSATKLKKKIHVVLQIFIR
jgi:hypothetical protein